jgi:hypothetical protein
MLTKDWRHISTRYGRSGHMLFLAICIAANVVFYLNQ